MAAHDEVLEFADGLVAQAAVEALGVGVEGGDADEHVGRLPEDTLLGIRDQPPADAPAAPLRSDSDRLDVAGEAALHVEDDEAQDVLPSAATYTSFPGEVSVCSEAS